MPASVFRISIEEILRDPSWDLPLRLPAQICCASFMPIPAVRFVDIVSPNQPFSGVVDNAVRVAHNPPPRHRPSASFPDPLEITRVAP
jgi:hypothetical protein